jgi:predicted deacylase
LKERIIRKNIQSKIITHFIILFFGIAVLSNCAIRTAAYLTPQGQVIKQQYWRANSYLFGYFMEGTKYQTPIFKFDSRKEGPTILILGGTHGNEPAGFETAYRLLAQFSTTPIQAGKIFVVPEANRVAVSHKNRRISVPEGIDFERGNLNRCYPGDPAGLPMEREAYQITEFIRSQNVDLFIDLHESPKFHLESRDVKGNYYGLGQTLIYTPNEEATWLAMLVADELNSRISEKMKQFSLVEHPIESSAAWSAGKHFNIPAFTVETCKKLPIEERIQYQLEILNLIFREKGMIE